MTEITFPESAFLLKAILEEFNDDPTECDTSGLESRAEALGITPQRLDSDGFYFDDDVSLRDRIDLMIGFYLYGWKSFRQSQLEYAPEIAQFDAEDQRQMNLAVQSMLFSIFGLYRNLAESVLDQFLASTGHEMLSQVNRTQVRSY